MTATSPPPLPADLTEGLKRLKMAAMRQLAPELLVTAKTQRWKPEEFLRTLVEAEITARDASNARTRLRLGCFPVTKTLEEFDVAASSIPAATFDYLSSLEWVRAAENVCMIGPAGTGKSHILVALGIAAVQAGHRVRYFTAADLVETLYRALADNSVGKVIDTLLRNDVVLLDELGFAPLDDTGTQLAKSILDRLDRVDQSLAELDQAITGACEPWSHQIELLLTIPGVGPRVAQTIVAETGADMSIFPTAAHLASWAGTSPGSNESAGRVKSTATRPGNRYLKAALGAAALSIANSHGTYLAAKYRRIAARRGPKKALVAIEHAILVAIWNMAHTGALYDDPGADYYTRHDPERARRNAVNQLQRLGYQVTLTPTAASA